MQLLLLAADGGGTSQVVAAFKENPTFMVLNLVCSAIVLTIVIERFAFQLSRYRVNSREFFAQVKKLVLAGKVWTALLNHDLVPDATLRWWGLAYVLLAGGLFALACLVVPAEFPRRFLAMIVFLIVPLVRPAAAPLALAWNRHR